MLMLTEKSMIFFYIVFLLVFVAGWVAVVGIDTSDKGDCKVGPSGEILVRQPDQRVYVERQFCIIIQI